MSNLSPAETQLILSAAASGISGLCLWGSLRQSRRRRLIEALPTSKALGVFVGLVEVKGLAESDRPLVSTLSEAACVWHEHTVAEEWRRTVTETYTDAEGKTRTRTRVESGWTTVASGGAEQSFRLRDETGAVRIVPDGADVVPRTVMDTICGPSDPLYYAKGPSRSVSDSTFRRRFTERIIPLGHPLYVIGQARERSDAVAAEITQSPAAPWFLISTRDEELERRSAGWSSAGFALAGAVVALFPAFWDGTGGGGRFQPEAACLWGGVYALAWGLTGWWSVHNSLVDLRHRVAAASGLVAIQLERRAALIPALCGVIEGFRRHERDVLETVARLRSEAASTAPGSPGADPVGAGALVVAIAEAYPEIKADGVFTRLSGELVDTEDRLALARRYFNDIATHANTRCETVPDRWFAPLAGLRPQSLLMASGYARDAVRVGGFDRE